MSSYLYKVVFTGPDGKVYSGESYSQTTFEKWMAQARNDRCPMMFASYEINSKTYPWYLQTRTANGYKTRTW